MRIRTVVSIVIVMLLSVCVYAAPFEDANAGFPNDPCNFAWGDYDGDGWMDLATVGGTTRIYHNDGGQFYLAQQINNQTPFGCSASWGDDDNDGDLDLLVAGVPTRIFRNYSGTFYEEATISTTERASPYAVWGDFDNDGDLDVIQALFSGYHCIYENNHGSYTPSAWVPIVAGLKLFPVDLDNDGYLDMYSNSSLFFNTGSGFTVADAWYTIGVQGWGYSWGDYNNDGYLDIRGERRLSRNNGNRTFTTAILGITAAAGCVAWGDYDNNGLLDVAASGGTSSNPTFYLEKNNGNGTFASVDGGFKQLRIDYLSWADYNRDRKLDLIAYGAMPNDPVASRYVALYTNKSAVTNTLPSTPQGLKATVSRDTVTFSWGAAADMETPTAALTYNIRVGTTPGGQQIRSSHSSLVTGERLIPIWGNCQSRRSYTMKWTGGTLYWSVQSVDGAYDASQWASEKVIYGPRDGTKRLSAGSSVFLRNMVVTAVFGDTFYVERLTRVEGIRVDKKDHTVKPGDVVTISGTLGIDSPSGEVMIAADLVGVDTTGLVGPFIVTNRSLGGGQCGIQEGVNTRAWKRNPETGEDELVWTPSQSLNNIGMLVRTTGMVRSIDPEGAYFYIDDGSCLRDGTSTNGMENIGVRVEGDGRGYTIGQQIMVTGISSCFKDSDGRLLRYLRVKTKTLL